MRALLAKVEDHVAVDVQQNQVDTDETELQTFREPRQKPQIGRRNRRESRLMPGQMGLVVRLQVPEMVLNR